MEGRWYVDPLTRVLLRAHTTAASKASPRPRIPASLRNTVFQSCHQTLIHLGDVRYADGRHQAAQHAWRRALAILEHLGHSDVEQVRSRLSR